ncbi:DUF4190 domain-containing protein [Streptomyces sp. MAR4 CNX-425]|uniref:DUF4190 domain-containing protein n=1 Tax=Streptomyces sp. MAR4 CNX-425 TaxID=3406343 RepID=UPI003B50FD2B
MNTDRRDDAAGRGALRVEAAREAGGPAPAEKSGTAEKAEGEGAAEGGGGPAAEAPAPVRADAGAPESADATGPAAPAPASDQEVLTPPDGGPPVPVAPGWTRPRPAPGSSTYGPKPYLPGPYLWVPPAGPRNGAGTAALVLGIIGAVLAFTLVFSPLAVILGALAIGFGVTAVRRVRRGEARNRASGLWGIWLGGVAAVAGVGMSVLLVVLAADFFAPVSPETDNAVEAGQTVTYDDGLEVTLVAEPVAEDVLEVRVRVLNRTGELVTLTSSGVSAYPVGSDDAYLEQEGADALPFTLDDDHVAIGTYHFAVDEELSDVEFEVSPGGPYEYAYWWKDLDGPDDGRAA